MKAYRAAFALAAVLGLVACKSSNGDRPGTGTGGDHSSGGSATAGSARDAPHEYVQLDQPVTARYAKLTNYHAPAGAVFSVNGLRIFGSGLGQPPEQVAGITAQRRANRRLMDVSWQASPSADFYIVRYGVRPDGLTRNHQVYGGASVTSITVPGLETDVDYFFTVDAVNDSGVTKGTQVKAVLSDHPG